MATLKHGDKEIKIKDGASIIDACDELGVPFGCKEGVCGSCEITVIEGMENLSPLSEHEKDFGISKKKRLACQCKILKGKVVIDF